MEDLTAKLAGLYLKNGTISEARLRRLLFPPDGKTSESTLLMGEGLWHTLCEAFLGPLPKDDIFSLGWTYDPEASDEVHCRNVTRFILDKMKERENATSKT